MKVYHSFKSKFGFHPDKQDYNRGVFAMDAWWIGRPEYEKYSAFHPNEFGDKAVELEIDEKAPTLKIGDQLDVLEKFFPNDKMTKDTIHKFRVGIFGDKRSDWHKLDAFIGKFLRQKGYKIIHYTADPMYGHSWAILDRSVIKGYRFEKDNVSRIKETQS